MDEQFIDFQGTYHNLTVFIKDVYNVSPEVAEAISKVLLMNSENSSLSSKDLNLLNLEEDNEKYQLYFRDTRIHICAKKFIIDLLVTAAISIGVGNTNPLVPVLSGIWAARNIFKKIDDRVFCVYLKIYYRGLTKGFTLKDINRLYTNKKCNNQTSLFNCPFKGENNTCELKEENIINILQYMTEYGILTKINDEKYRITV